MSVTFVYPYLLLGLLGLPVLAWLKGQRGRSPAFLYSSINLVKKMSHVPKSAAGAWLNHLRWLTLACFIVAMARPQLGEGEAKISASGIDIVVCIDLSRSMEAEDFQMDGKTVNRLFIAKDVVKKFIEQRPSDRIGLIAFAGRAYVAGPLTLDHDFLVQNLERLGFGGIEEGTAIGSGLIAAVNRLRDIKSKSKIVILMTDGQNNMGKVPPATAAEAAQALKIKVYTVGVGKQGTAPWPYTDQFGRRVYRQMPVDIDEPTLKEVAAKTGGVYYRADSTDTLRKIYADIDRLEKTTIEVKKYQRYRDVQRWPIAFGLGFLLLEIILSHTIWRKLP
jgi:Ca-activated chloride channel family protein